MYRIKFDRHAKRRMKWRRISEEEVEMTIMQPDYTEDTVKNRKNSYKKINERLIKVTYIQIEEEIVVITVIDKSES